MRETTARIDYNSRFWTKNNFANRWLGLRLDFIGAGLTGLSVFACVIAIRAGGGAGAGGLDAGLVGLVLTYTGTLTGLLNWGVRRFSEAELGLVAVERTRELFKCPQEGTAKPLPSVPADWPQQGAIQLAGVQARYREGLDLVIKGLDLDIPKHTKVGVVGRTGSGKSTLAKLLFRFLELVGGSITIDGIDISRVPLETLRARLTMIPQDPVLFAGPVRYSLDPAGKYTEEQLWAALEGVGLKQFFTEQVEGGLEADVAAGGENLSAGQRQLLCMARALLEKPSVLIMDEATSNIDGQTDERIQTMLRNSFSECTVISIAHRIDTIMWYDRVLVLEAGRVLEYDSPSTLAARPGSAFGALLDEYREGKSE